MTEYIERNAALEVLKAYGKRSINKGRYMLDAVDDIVLLEEEIDAVPAVDVAPVVRCRACVHGIWDSSSALWQCVKDADYDEEIGMYTGFSAWHDADFYCADGEVRECIPIR